MVFSLFTKPAKKKFKKKIQKNIKKKMETLKSKTGLKPPMNPKTKKPYNKKSKQYKAWEKKVSNVKKVGAGALVAGSLYGLSQLTPKTKKPLEFEHGAGKYKPNSEARIKKKDDRKSPGHPSIRAKASVAKPKVKKKDDRKSPGHPSIRAKASVAKPKVTKPVSKVTKPVSKVTKPVTSKSLKVKSGDTLSQIAKKHGTTLKALLAANPKIKNPNMIRIGQSIKLSAPVKDRKSVYQGLSKKEMGKMKMVKRAGAGAIIKPAIRKKLKKLSDKEKVAEYIKQGKMTKVPPRVGGANIERLPTAKELTALQKEIKRIEKEIAQLQGITGSKKKVSGTLRPLNPKKDLKLKNKGGGIKRKDVPIQKFPEHKPRKNYGKKRRGRSKDPIVRAGGGSLFIASLYD